METQTRVVKFNLKDFVCLATYYTELLEFKETNIYKRFCEVYNQGDSRLKSNIIGFISTREKGSDNPILLELLKELNVKNVS